MSTIDSAVRVTVADDAYVVELEVPEHASRGLLVELDGLVATVRGEHWEESFRLPDAADVDDVNAYYEDGVLELRVAVARHAGGRRRIPVLRKPPGLLHQEAEGV